MDALTSSQLLDQAQAVMKDEVMDIGLTVVAAQILSETKEVLSEDPCNNMTC